MDTLANSEDLNEMLQNVAFHHGLHYLLRLIHIQSSGNEIWVHKIIIWKFQPMTP